MNKLPIKQIYLLSIIVIGIIALSVYSTYAIFTFEGSISNVVTIHTPKSLKISENIYEYQQLKIEPNTVATTDIDIYNSYEYDICYSIWYKIIGTENIKDKIQIFEKSSNTLSSSGTLEPQKNKRITIVIINDNNEEIKVNIGTLGSKKENDSCHLNLSEDKKLISSSYENIEILREKILNDKNEVEEKEESYLTYKVNNDPITYKKTDKIYTSTEFTYKDEVFTLNKPIELTLETIDKENNLETKEIYFCKDKDNCKVLYKFSKLTKREENSQIYYDIKEYDKLIGYSKGKNGLRKINDQDYIFYGDNPNNFIYYNCENNDDSSTCELWRIIGLFYNKELKQYNIKIIRNDSIGKYYFDNTKNETLTWNNSTINKYLNEEYKFIGNNEIYLEEYKQKSEMITFENKEIKKLDEEIKSKVTLINVIDYLNTSECNIKKINELTTDCIKNNWLSNNDIDSEWLMTQQEKLEPEKPEEIVEENTEQEPTEDNEDIEKIEEPEEEIIEEPVIINYFYTIENNLLAKDTNEILDIRPVIYLKSRIILLSGNGSLEKPYLIK